jgi:hypothetical protein
VLEGKEFGRWHSRRASADPSIFPAPALLCWLIPVIPVVIRGTLVLVNWSIFKNFRQNDQFHIRSENLIIKPVLALSFPSIYPRTKIPAGRKQLYSKKRTHLILNVIYRAIA